MVQNAILQSEYSTTMNISRLGTLRPDTNIPEWLISPPVSVPYFDGSELAFTLAGLTEADTRDVQKAVDAFLALDSDARRAASSYVFKNYQKFADAVGEGDIDCHPASPERIWDHVHPTDVYVSRRDRRDMAIYVQIAARCDWEPEHGLQIIYRDGNELSRVSGQDGHLTHTDAYDLPEEEDRIV